jgi:PIN domain nuclease of toxin-antitoxin system
MGAPVKLLADTHVLVWLTMDPGRLTPAALAATTDRANQLLVSTASVWEMSIKHRLGKLPQAAPLVEDLDGSLATLGADLLAVSGRHAIRAGQLSWDHRDPFDRMLAAQALAEDAALVSADRAFISLPGLNLLW